MRKIIPLIFSGVAAVSFSTLVLAQSSASSDKAVAADNDNDPRTGVLNQGRSVGTAGSQPDSSQSADEESRRNTSRGATAPVSDVRPGGVGSSTSGAGSSGTGAAGAGAGGAAGAGAGGAGGAGQ